MCSYCGCRAITVIGRLSTGHEAIINAAGALRRAATAHDGDVQSAVQLLSGLLDPHTTDEERGLFAELRLDAEFADHVDVLCREHRDIDAHLTRIGAGDCQEVEALETLLRRHIDKEENGLFPAAAIALDGDAWNRIEERTA